MPGDVLKMYRVYGAATAVVMLLVFFGIVLSKDHPEDPHYRSAESEELLTENIRSIVAMPGYETAEKREAEVQFYFV